MYSVALAEVVYFLPYPRQTENQMDFFRLRVRLSLLHLRLHYRTRLLAQMQRQRNRATLRQLLSTVPRV